MRGRKTLPKEIKKLQGTYRNFRENHEAPDPKKANSLEPPEFLNELAKEEYRRKAALLDKLGIFREGDDVALAAYAEAYARWVDAVRRYNATGPLVKSKRDGGLPARNPLCYVINASLEQMHKFLVEFGLTPVSRTRIKVDDKPKVNEWDMFSSSENMPVANSNIQ